MTDRLHMLPKHRTILESLLEEHLPEVEVWAYGSRVNGRSHDGSDLDLVLRAPGLNEIPVHQVSEFKDAVRESAIPFLVETRDWAQLPERFHREIERRHIVLEVADNLTASVTRSAELLEWKQLNLGGVCSKIGSGATPRGGKDAYLSSGPYALIRSQNVFNNGFRTEGLAYIGELQATKLKNVEVARDDVLLNITGDSVARVCQVRSDILPARVNQHVAIIRPNPSELDPRFLRYALVAPDMQVKLLSWASSGGTRNALTKGMIESLDIAIPPNVQEQRAIAHVLGALDDKIELNQRMNETLEAMARAIFKDWFVDFGPTRAKVEGLTPYLATELWNLFPDALDDKGKPVGWERKPLDEIAMFLNGLALQKFPSSDPSDSLPVIKIAELRSGITGKSNRASREVPLKYIVKDGDFLFSWSGSLLTKFWTEGEGALNQHLFKVSSNQYPAWFFSQWVYHYLEEFQAIAAAKATTMGHIQRRHLKEALTNCPPDDALSVFGLTIGPLVERTIENKLEARTLSKIRDLLLPKLISGEIRLTQAEEIVEEAI